MKKSKLYLVGFLCAGFVFLGFSKAYAACTSPSGSAGSLNWNTDHFEYCDGTSWLEFGGGGPYTIYWKIGTFNTNAFPDCGTGAVQLACRRGTNTTVTEESGWFSTPGQQTLRLDYNSNGSPAAVYGFVTNGGAWAYRQDTSAYTNVFTLYLGPPNYVPFEWGDVSYSNDGGSTWGWGYCLCGMGAP